MLLFLGKGFKDMERGECFEASRSFSFVKLIQKRIIKICSQGNTQSDYKFKELGGYREINFSNPLKEIDGVKKDIKQIYNFLQKHGFTDLKVKMLIHCT